MTSLDENDMRVVVEVPASAANLGPGFDTLGLALELRNSFEFRFGGVGLSIDITGEGADQIPRDEQHLSYRACMAVLRQFGLGSEGMALRQVNRVPFAGGLGNSATAVVAGVLAANALAGGRMSDEEVLQVAATFEGHPDNVAPALLGGLVISSRGEDGRVKSMRLHVPEGLTVVLAVPEFSVNTASARRVLPKDVTLEDAVFNVGRVSFLVAAFCSGRFEHLSAAMEDRLHQPYRAQLVPGLDEVCRAARLAGASGVALSGAGPTVIALACTATAPFERIGEAMTEAFLAAGVRSRYLVVSPSCTGAAVQVAGQLT